MAARPVAVGAGANVERHPQAIAHVEARPAHFRQFPARAEVARAPLRVSLEAAACEHHCARVEVDGLAADLGFYTQHALAVVDQRYSTRFVENLDAFFDGCIGEVLHQARAAARHLDRHAPEEFALARDDGRLGAVGRHEAHALAAQPHHGFQAFRDQSFAEFRVSAVACDAKQIVEELILRVAVPIGVLRLVIGDLGD